MKWVFFSFLFVLFTGCKSSPKPGVVDPLKGIHQFKVILLPVTDLEKEAFFKAVVSSFEKIGDVRLSKENVCRIEDDLPILLLSLIGDEHRGSISIFAEAEVLINRCRIGSQIWKLDFNGKKEVVFPEIQEDGVGFRKEQQYEEDLGPILLQEKMVEQFAKGYWEVNSVRPTFYFHSNFLADSEITDN